MLYIAGQPATPAECRTLLDFGSGVVGSVAALRCPIGRVSPGCEGEVRDLLGALENTVAELRRRIAEI